MSQLSVSGALTRTVTLCSLNMPLIGGVHGLTV